jgi:hypothetical protein
MTYNSGKILRDRVDYCLQEIDGIYGNILDIPNINEILLNVEYMSKNWRAFARTDPRNKHIKHSISLNPLYLEDYLPIYVDEIIPHELSHIVCFTNELDDGHGDMWKDICIDMGGTGELHVNF